MAEEEVDAGMEALKRTMAYPLIKVSRSAWQPSLL